MAKDYGQRGSGGRQARPRRSSDASHSGVPGWVWMVAGLCVGLAIAAIVYIKRPLKPTTDNDSITAVMPDKPDNQKKDPIKLPPKEKPRFTFYELLPNQEVVVPRDVQAPAGAKAGAASTDDDGLYIIQVASYRKQADADAQRAKLALLGVEARVEKITIDNKDTFYRVRTAPERGLARAHTTMARLESNGLQQTMMVKVK